MLKVFKINCLFVPYRRTSVALALEMDESADKPALDTQNCKLKIYGY